MLKQIFFRIVALIPVVWWSLPLHCKCTASLHCVEQNLETWTMCTQNPRNFKNWVSKYTAPFTFHVLCFIWSGVILQWFSFCKKANKNEYCQTVTGFFPFSLFIPVLGRHEVRSWTRATQQSLCLMWQKVKVHLMLSMSFLVAVYWYCRSLYSFLAQLLKRWVFIMQALIFHVIAYFSKYWPLATPLWPLFYHLDFRWSNYLQRKLISNLFVVFLYSLIPTTTAAL